MRVHPTLIPESKQLANVDGVLNAVMVVGDAVGELVLVGAGAGGAATASSVCADLIDIARNPAGSGPALGVPVAQLTAKPLVPAGDIASEWYVRLTAADQPDVTSKISQILTSFDIGIASLVQKSSSADEGKAPIVLLTQIARESVMTQAIDEICGLVETDPDVAVLRVESFDQ
jgi:homoserine dehydrogenase